MKKRIFQVLAALVLLAILPLSLVCSGLSLPSYYAESYYAQLGSMYHRLTDAEGPKVVVVGGSSVAFGLDTALMERLLAQKGFHYTVCSFGLYAAVGVSAMLDLSENALGPGDIVVLAVEPTAETMSVYFGASAFWKCAEDCPELLPAVGPDKQRALLGNYIPYLQERWSIHTSGILPKAEGVYAKGSFDERCDMVYPRPGNTMPLGFDTSSPIDLAGIAMEEDFVRQVNRYCAAAQKRGASVVMSFSPMNRSALADASQEAVEAYFTRCNTAFSCPLISDPNRYIMDSGWFYDSNFHLNSAGAVVHTVALAQDLLAWLGCYESVDCPLPSIPPAAAALETDDTGAEYFTLAPAGELSAWLVSGLTQEGLAQTQLTVPSSFEGQPVIGFAPEALDAAASLEELRLPQSVESLPDGLFRGCPRLTRLVLTHTQSPCQVSEHTFDGADQVKVYVPLEAYPMYRDGFGCLANPWDRFLDRVFSYG